MLGQFFFLGSCLFVAESWNDRPGELNQGRFIKRAANSTLSRWKIRPTTAGVDPPNSGFHLFNPLFPPLGHHWSLIGCAPCEWSRVWDQPWKGIYFPTASLHSSPVSLFCMAFTFLCPLNVFFFFSVETSSNCHLWSLFPYSNCLTKIATTTREVMLRS